MKEGNVWAVVVSIKHHSVQKLVTRLIALGFVPARIIVFTNMNPAPLEALGIPSENIRKKGQVGYVGSLIMGAEVVMQFDTNAIIVNLSSEFEGELDDMSELLFSATLMARRTHAILLGSTETEDGISVWRAEAIMAAVMKGVSKRAKFKELTTNLSQCTIL